MTTWFPDLAFALALLLLILLPFVPVWREWRTPTDFLPIAVPLDDVRDPHYLSDRFRLAVELELAGKQPTSNMSFEYVRAPPTQIDWSKSTTPLLALSKLRIDKNIDCTRPLFVKRDFEAGSGNRFQALLSNGSITLGERTVIREWAHADGVLHLAAHSVALNRISSAARIDLSLHCCFERVTAPVIRFGSPTPSQKVRDRNALVTAHFIDLPRVVKKTATLFYAIGDCRLHPGRTYRGTLIVTGRLWIGSDTSVIGDIKARGGIVIGPYASVLGSVTCENSIEIQTQALATGPVISETLVILGTDCRVGSRGHSTTISAPAIVARGGSIAHGTVWARETGVVSESESESESEA